MSTESAATNPEGVAARARGLAVLHRGALLAQLMHERRGIAIAGTHGKTTTTAMLAVVLEAAGFGPGVVVGGERTDTGTNASDGGGAWFLGEADESDRSFLDLRPEIAVVNNIENDHILSDAELPQLRGAFERFAAAVPAGGLVLCGADDPGAAALAAIPRAARTQTFGFAAEATLRARDVRYAGFGSRFTVEQRGTPLGEAALAVPGAINILDALPAIAVGLELGAPFATIARALENFSGVRRRFQILAATPRLTVVDDYAHHPTAIAATIAAARRGFAGPLVVAFQPHRYSRTQYLADEFARALGGADAVVLTDIYAASETAIAGIAARTIGDPLAASGVAVAYVGDVGDVEALPAYLLAHVPAGALVLMLGAGSITDAAAALAERLHQSEAIAP